MEGKQTLNTKAADQLISPNTQDLEKSLQESRDWEDGRWVLTAGCKALQSPRTGGGGGGALPGGLALSPPPPPGAWRSGSREHPQEHSRVGRPRLLSSGCCLEQLCSEPHLGVCGGGCLWSHHWWVVQSDSHPDPALGSRLSWSGELGPRCAGGGGGLEERTGMRATRL